VSAGDDVKLAPLVRDPRHGQRHRGVDVAEDEVGLVAIDQLLGFDNSGVGVVSGILDQELDLSAENAAGLVDLFER